MTVFADDNKATQELLQDMKAFGKMNEQVQKIGTLKENCISCIDQSSIQKVSLENSFVDLGKPLFTADDVAVVIYLKRTSSSPAKIDLKLKNTYRYCEKTLIGGMAGGLAMGCLLYLNQDIDEKISLNLKNLPPLKNPAEEIIELKLTKSDINKAKYTLEVKNLSNPQALGNIGEKFFTDGFNVDFKMSAGE